MSKKPASPKPRTVTLLVGTRKGAFLLKSDAGRRHWTLKGPQFLGCVIHHLVADPRERGVLLMAARTGHLGPTVFRSEDGGRNWKEAKRPPRFPKQPGAGNPLIVNHVFWLTPGHASEPGVWYAGTSPQALFRSSDGGVTWRPVKGFNEHPMWSKWTGGGRDGTPDGSKMHSILVDPRDRNRLVLGMSGGGIFESRDRGRSWEPLNENVFIDFGPDPYPEYGQDPHCIVQHPLHPDRLYHQNHCGLYRLDRPSTRWERIGDNMPAEIGDIGFPVVVHPRDPDRLWVVPMDATRVWPRTSPGGKPCVYHSRDGGRSFRRQDAGFPRENAWWTVKRQSMAIDSGEPSGLYLGTTNGEIWASRDAGRRWRCIVRHLPHVYSVEVVEGLR